MGIRGGSNALSLEMALHRQGCAGDSRRRLQVEKARSPTAFLSDLGRSEGHRVLSTQNLARCGLGCVGPEGTCWSAVPAQGFANHAPWNPRLQQSSFRDPTGGRGFQKETNPLHLPAISSYWLLFRLPGKTMPTERLLLTK